MSIARPLRHTTHLTTALSKNTPHPRHASLLRRPKRPYTFTQLVLLSDGSAYTHRTTSPAAVYKSNKDTRNSALWNPSSQKLMNVEKDDAGRLKAFRTKFGRGWDAETGAGAGVQEGEGGEGEGDESLLDLISGFGQGEGEVAVAGPAKGAAKGKEGSGKGKGGER